MAIVAVAGGTGNTGRALVDGLLWTKKHKVIILARNPNPTLEKELGVPIIAVDYADVQAVTKVLEENNVDTVISAIMMTSAVSGEQPKEIQLIHAADASQTTKRMILSDWGFPHAPDHATYFESVRQKEAAQAELKNVKSLETTHVKCGFFMDFWANAHGVTTYSEMPMFIDIANEAAAIPGDGNTPINITHTRDVGRFVAASLDLEKWDPELHVIGDTVTMNDLLHFAEEAKGKKFSVTHDSVEKLKAGEPTFLPGQENIPKYPKPLVSFFTCTFGPWFAEGVLNYTPEKKLNDVFPEIKPLKAKEAIFEAWKQN